MYERDRSNTINKELMKFYFNNQPITLNNAVTHANVSTVITKSIQWIHFSIIMIIITKNNIRNVILDLCWCNYDLSSSSIRIANNRPLYFYLFNYEGPYSIFMWSDQKPYGTILNFYRCSASRRSLLSVLQCVLSNDLKERSRSFFGQQDDYDVG